MGRVRETLHDVLRQTDAVLLALCVASTLYGMVLIASATSFRGTLKYVAVQGLGLLIGLVLYFFLSSIDVFELAKQWKWLLGFNVGFLLLLLTPFGQTRNGNRAWLGVNDIGKNLVKIMMEGSGLEVVDLGVDVSAEQFVDAAVAQHCDIIACSSLLTTTMPEMRAVVELTKARGIRDQVKIFVGGAPITQGYSDEIGADAYCPDAASAARTAVAMLRGA